MKSFLTLKHLFGVLPDDKEQELFSSLLFTILVGAAKADLNIESNETAKIASILKEKLGSDVSQADIKTAGEIDASTQEIVKNVKAASHRLSLGSRQELLVSMVEVFRSDGSIGPLEQEYFNSIVDALDLTPAQMMQL